MPIVVQHEDPTVMLDAATASRNRQDQRIAQQRDFQRDMQAQDIAVRQQENIRNHQRQLEAIEAAAQNRQEEEAQAFALRRQAQVDAYKLKDTYEKRQINKKRSEYLQKKEKVEEAYNNGQGNINFKQFNQAMETLQSNYSGGDVDVTDPYFSDIEKQGEEHPMYDLPDGQKIPMAIDRNGNPDPFTTRKEWEKLQIEHEKIQSTREKEELKKREKYAEDFATAKVNDMASKLGKDKDGNPLQMSPLDFFNHKERIKKEVMQSFDGNQHQGMQQPIQQPADIMQSRIQEASNIMAQSGRNSARDYIDKLNISDQEKHKIALALVISNRTSGFNVRPSAQENNYDPPELIALPTNNEQGAKVESNVLPTIKPADAKAASKAPEKVITDPIIKKEIEETEKRLADAIKRTDTYKPDVKAVAEENVSKLKSKLKSLKEGKNKVHEWEEEIKELKSSLESEKRYGVKSFFSPVYIKDQIEELEEKIREHKNKYK